MTVAKNILTNTPFIIRVVCLYVMVASSLLWAVHFMPADSFATSSPTPVVVQTPVVSDEAIAGQPSRLTIERLGINLAIINGEYDAACDSWTLTDVSAQFDSMTAMPNYQSGNTFIYGHNTKAVFEPVKNIRPGDVLTVTTTNGRVFTYRYVDDMTVTPDRADVLKKESTEPMVTLMTCQGMFSETRRLLHFTFEGVA